jgi:predicted PurR-regulated permease PerM
MSPDDRVASVQPEPGRQARVRPRDVWTVIWVIWVASASLVIVYEIRRVLVWLVVSIFFAAVLSPAVAFVERRGLGRGLAVATVMLTLLLVVGGTSYAFVQTLVRESVEFAENLPETVDKIREAPIVRDALERFNIEDRVEQVSPDLPRQLLGLSGPLVAAFKTIGQLIIGLITIVVLTIFLLLYGPGFVRSGLELIENGAVRRRVEGLGAESLQAVSGWVAGNVLTSVIAAIASLVAFLLLGLPYAWLLALWVAIADLIPLVGATLGAIPAIIVAFIESPFEGIVVMIFFVVYQQFENHVLQPAVYGRTIRLNPFLVLLSVLVGVELAGFLGALLALPVAGIVQIVVIDAAEHRRGDDSEESSMAQTEELAPESGASVDD